MARRSDERLVNFIQRQRGVGRGIVGCEQSAYELKWHLCVCCENYQHVIQLLLHATKYRCYCCICFCCCIYGLLCVVIIATTTTVAIAICGCCVASLTVVALSLFACCLLIVRSLSDAQIHSYTCVLWLWHVCIRFLLLTIFGSNYCCCCCCVFIAAFQPLLLFICEFLSCCLCALLLIALIVVCYAKSHKIMMIYGSGAATAQCCRHPLPVATFGALYVAAAR